MIRRGEVYWLDLGEPHGSVQGRMRPVLIVQNDKGNASSPTTIVAAMTSQQKMPYPFHVDFTAAESGLDKDGTVLLEQLQTINKDELGSLAGSLPTLRMAAVDQALRWSLALR